VLRVFLSQENSASGGIEEKGTENSIPLFFLSFRFYCLNPFCKGTKDVSFGCFEEKKKGR
jgi:hypothetical protein